ncbi:Uncharacterised protein [Nocardiopsis dassonvillei]|nr:Uncharacterised protein [Nocardiopsis dassonvillei]
MFRLRPDTTAVSIPGTGHDVHLERTDTLRRIIQEFLRDIPEHPAHRRA